jgi:triosephosphate isomerase
MLRDAGCRYVIVGHSERRLLCGEDDEIVGRKLRAVLAVGLIPILCIGEQLAERDAGLAESVVSNQLDRALKLVPADAACRLAVAYEPVWAIGTGRTATPEQAQTMHELLRSTLAARYDEQLAGMVRIVYGGSVKADNAASLLRERDIDGALVGGASLDAMSFAAIVAAAG